MSSILKQYLATLISLSFVASVLVVLNIATPAVANNVANTSQVLVATMWERSKSLDVVNPTDSTDVLTFSGDEYFYRIHASDSSTIVEQDLTPVDMQSTTGLTRLSPTEQEQYYQDFWKFDPGAYEFTWLVGLCVVQEAENTEALIRPQGPVISFDRVELDSDPVDNTPAAYRNEWEGFEVFEEFDVQSPFRILNSYQYLPTPSTTEQQGIDFAFDDLVFPDLTLEDGTTKSTIRSSGFSATANCAEGFGLIFPLADVTGTRFSGRTLDLNQDIYLPVPDGSPPIPIDLAGKSVFVHGGPIDLVIDLADFDPFKLQTVAHFGVTQVAADFTVSFGPNGADAGSLPADVQVAAGNYTPPGNTTGLAREGYKFLGWSTDFTASEPMTQINIASNTRLFAVWEKLQKVSGPAGPVAFSDQVIHATMFETERTFTLEAPNPADNLVVTGDEYFYRITAGENEELVDLQSAGGLDRLTQQEQNDYYRDYWKYTDQDPYYFYWTVAVCYDIDESALLPVSVSNQSTAAGMLDENPIIIFSEATPPTTSSTVAELDSFWSSNSLGNDDGSSFFSSNEGLVTGQFLKADLGSAAYDFKPAEHPNALPTVGYADDTSEPLLRISQRSIDMVCPSGALPWLMELATQSEWEQESFSPWNRSLDLNKEFVLPKASPFDTNLVPIDLAGRHVVVFGVGAGEDDTVAHFGITKVVDRITLSFDAGGADSGTVPENIVTGPGTIELPSNPGNLVKSGHRLVGWSTDPEATVWFPNFDAVTDSVLYPVWIEIETVSGGSTGGGFSAGFSGPVISSVSAETELGALSQTVSITGERLANTSKVLISDLEAEILEATDTKLLVSIPDGLPVGTHDIEILSPLGNISYPNAFETKFESSSYGELKAWTKRISETEAKVYVKYPSVGNRIQITMQTGGSGDYSPVVTRTVTSLTDEFLTVNDNGTYLVRTVNLTDINRIRVIVDGEKLVQVVYR